MHPLVGRFGRQLARFVSNSQARIGRLVQILYITSDLRFVFPIRGRTIKVHKIGDRRVGRQGGRTVVQSPVRGDSRHRSAGQSSIYHKDLSGHIRRRRAGEKEDAGGNVFGFAQSFRGDSFLHLRQHDIA